MDTEYRNLYDVVRGYIDKRLWADCLEDIVTVHIIKLESPHLMLIGFRFNEYDWDKREWIEIKISRKLKKFGLSNIRYTYTFLSNKMLENIFSYSL